MITLVPPYGDPSLRLDDDDVLDVTALFVADLLDSALAEVPPAGARPAGDDHAAALLMRTAGAAALRRRGADPVHRLRGLGALLTGLAAEDHGVRLRLDDLELTNGSTESSADILRAAASPAPYDPGLARAAETAAGHREITLVIERDQQLAAAVRLAGQLGSGHVLRVTGRFATAHWATLRTLAAFASATVEPSPRGLRWTVVDPFGSDAVPRVSWRERAADPWPAGRWAGRVGIRDVLARPGAISRAHTVIVPLCADPDRVLGRCGTVARWPDLAAAVNALRDAGTHVLAELWVGAPGYDPHRAADGLRAAAEVVDRVAGFRVFDWPVGWHTPRWAGQPIAVEPTGHDLARQHRLIGQQPANRLRQVITALARPAARAGLLVPGRIAAAYLRPPYPYPYPPPELGLDLDVVLGAHSTRTGAGVAVNLRTGSCTKVNGSLSSLIAAQPPAAVVREALATLPAETLRDLRAGDVLVGGPP